MANNQEKLKDAQTLYKTLMDRFNNLKNTAIEKGDFDWPNVSEEKYSLGSENDKKTFDQLKKAVEDQRNIVQDLQKSETASEQNTKNDEKIKLKELQRNLLIHESFNKDVKFDNLHKNTNLFSGQESSMQLFFNNIMLSRDIIYCLLDL